MIEPPYELRDPASSPNDVQAAIYGGLLAAIIILFAYLVVYARSKIVTAPGITLNGVARFFYSRKTMERVFEPLLADMREEYFAALAEGRVWKARWVRFSYYWAFAKAVGLQSLVSTVKKIFSLRKLL